MGSASGRKWPWCFAGTIGDCRRWGGGKGPTCARDEGEVGECVLGDWRPCVGGKAPAFARDEGALGRYGSEGALGRSSGSAVSMGALGISVEAGGG